MKILAIETSCDDTSVAIVEDGSFILSSVVATQLEHSKYGGVVPELAARSHMANMVPVLDAALKEAEVTWDEIDTIAVTKGPGLIGSLIVGVNTSRSLAYLHKKPLIAVHHTEGHIYANWLSKEESEQPIFPLVCLTVSGGHTNIIFMKDHLDYDIVAETHDDAAGEAYDKVAKMLGLGYPGGPLIAMQSLLGDSCKYKFPVVDLTPAPSRDSSGFLVAADPNMDFSYSGLKTAVLRQVKALTTNGRSLSKAEISDIAASFQYTANEILAQNLERAIDKFKPKTILLSGGVASNLSLRKQVEKRLKQKSVSSKLFYPEPKCCTDNAAMIAAAAYRHALNNEYTDPGLLTPDPNYKLI
jgi:N6-L-threonylcarbamoyladenine synthase